MMDSGGLPYCHEVFLNCGRKELICHLCSRIAQRQATKPMEKYLTESSLANRNSQTNFTMTIGKRLGDVANKDQRAASVPKGITWLGGLKYLLHSTIDQHYLWEW